MDSSTIFCSSCDKLVPFGVIQKSNKKFCKICFSILNPEVIDYSLESNGGAMGSLSGIGISIQKNSKNSHNYSGKRDGIFIDTRNVVGRKYEKMNQTSKEVSSIEKNLRIAKEKIASISTQFYIPPEVKFRSLDNLKKILEKTLIRGRSLDSVLLGLICLSFRQNGDPKTLKEFMVKLGISKKEIGRNVSFVSKILNHRGGCGDPLLFLEKYLAIFRFPEIVASEARTLLEEILKEKKAIGKGPSSVIIVILNFLNHKHNLKIDTKTMLSISSISEITFKQRSQYLEPFLR